MSTDRLARDKATIRAEPERRARTRRFITYGEAAKLVGRSAGGLGEILRAIRAEEAARGRPDLGALVVLMSTALPSHVGTGQDAREKAIAIQEPVFAVWAG